jgi:acyl-CoA synthetase
LDLGIIVPGLTGSCVILSRMSGLPQAAAELVEHDATWTSGPPAEIPAIVEAHRSAGRERDATLRIFATGGTTVRRALIEQGEPLGIHALRSYGMTECPSVSMPSESDTADQRLSTDGRIAPGCECEAVDPASREPLPRGEEGELRVRGPERMLGYLDAQQSREQLDRDGWFYSGDLGVVDDDDCVLITGRIKDIINRGGEKFSAREIEDVLIRHRGIADVAVVPAADGRFGEVPAAFIVAHSGEDPPSEEELGAYLTQQGVARQKTPVHWRWVDALPTTPSGKVKKYQLRQALDAGAAGGHDTQEPPAHHTTNQ